MVVLVVPHAPLGEWWQGSRHYHLLRHLGPEFDVHVVGIQSSSMVDDSPNRPITVHPLWTPRTFYRRFTKSYPSGFWLAHAQFFFRRGLNRLIKSLKPDVVLLSSNHHFVGFPPERLGPRVVFDYLDISPDFVEAWYCRNSSAVVAITEALKKSADGYGKPVTLIPNGADLDRFEGGSRTEAKERLGLDPGKPLVSLIGLTCSHRLYFVDAVQQLVQAGIPIQLAIVGGGSIRDDILKKCEALNLSPVLAPGQLAYRDTDDYFLASDVGLYPGDDVPYYQEASPLKVVEYLAAGSQVVSSPVNMFRETSAVQIAADSAEAFAEAIREALDNPQPSPDLTRFSWAELGKQMADVLRG